MGGHCEDDKVWMEHCEDDKVWVGIVRMTRCGWGRVIVYYLGFCFSFWL